MAEGDFQEKTEDASQKKLSDERKKGKVAKSQDLTSATLLMAGVFIFYVFSDWIFSHILNLFKAVFNNLNYNYGMIDQVIAGGNYGVYYMVITLIPLLIGIFITSLIVNIVQVGFLFSIDPIKPKGKKINIFDVSNYKKFFELQALVKLVFGLCKLTVIGIVCYFLIIVKIDEAMLLMLSTPQDLIVFILWNTFVMAVVTALILMVLGIGEFTYQKWKFSQDMKMTKQEVKEERKQMEGDVQMKSKMRAMMHSFSQTRMKENVPHADVVIANPIHYAVALKYDPEKMAAPVCIAKGQRKIALQIREIAENSEVAVVENPPLAQGLYRTVEVGQGIPPEFFHTVAEVLAHVYKLNDALQATGPQPK